MKPLAAMLLALAVLVRPLPAVADQAVVLDQARLAGLAGLPPLRGDALEPARLAGKVVIVTFIASWCPPCHAEFDHLKAVKNHYGAAVEIVAVNIFEGYGNDQGGRRLEAFLDRKAPPFILLGEGHRVAPLFADVKRIPTLYVFDGAGQPRLAFIHARGAAKTHVTEQEVRAAVERALAAG